MFSMPTSSVRPRRMPEKVITLGKPAAAVASIAWRRRVDALGVFLLVGKALGEPVAAGSGADQAVFFSVGQSSGATTSIDFSPNAAACTANSSTDMGSKHQWTTDWCTRPRVTTAPGRRAFAGLGQRQCRRQCRGRGHPAAVAEKLACVAPAWCSFAHDGLLGVLYQILLKPFPGELLHTPAHSGSPRGSARRRPARAGRWSPRRARAPAASAPSAPIRRRRRGSGTKRLGDGLRRNRAAGNGKCPSTLARGQLGQ